MNSIKKALFLTDTIATQLGGDPTTNLEKMRTNTNNYVTFKDKKIAWIFDEHNTKTMFDSKYLGSGTYTAVFSLKLVKNETTFKQLNTNTRYILRVVDDTEAEIDNFIKIWQNDKQKYPKNIIDIFYHGSLILNNTAIARYVMTKHYNDDKEILKLNVFQRQIFMCNMLRFLSLMKQNNIFYRDFKWWNIGFDNTNDLNFIVLDYDSKTLLPYDDPFIVEHCINTAKMPINENNMYRYNHNSTYCNGTYLPYFMTALVQDKVNPKLDKSYSVALAVILYLMYFKPDNDNITSMSDSGSDMFFHVGLTNDQNQKPLEYRDEELYKQYRKAFDDMALEFEPTFTENDFMVDNKYFRTNIYENFLNFLKITITNLVDVDYDVIMYPQRILKLFVRVEVGMLPNIITEDDLINAYCKN